MTSRRLIGLAGCPGAGKSTFAAGLAAEHGADAIVVPMDGFHLRQSELAARGSADRKGAPDTFDVAAYVDLLERLRADDGPVLAPAFDRHAEEPVADAIRVDPHHRLVVTEGNYLLLDRDGWERVHPLLDECWYVECGQAERVGRLMARHVDHGRTAAQAADWIRRVDEPNAAVVRATRPRADAIVHATSNRLQLPLQGN